MMKFLLLLLILVSIYSMAASQDNGGEESSCGCCAHKRKLLEEQQQQASEPEAFIVDPHDVPPDTCKEGHPRFIPDPNAVQPDYWDEEEDGSWNPTLVENPSYSWKARLIPNPDYAPPQSAALKYWNRLVDEVNEAIPWVTMGVFLVGVLSVAVPLPLDWLQSQLSETTSCKTIAKAALLGLATPLCSCGSLPIALGFVKRGIPLSSVVAFLTASQSAGLDSALITFGLLGPMAALCRLLGALLLAVMTGTVLQTFSLSNKSGKEQVESLKDSTRKSSASTKPTKDVEPTTPTRSVALRVILSLVDTASEIFPLVFLGLALSVSAMHFVPMLTAPFPSIAQETNRYSAWLGDLLLRVGVLTLSLPLQVCEHTTATIAAGIQKAGGGPGLAFAFLLAAPATNLPSLLFLVHQSSLNANDRFCSLKVALSLSCTALFLSYAVDLLGIDLLVRKEAESANNEMASLPAGFVRASPYVAGTLAFAGLLRTITKRWKSQKVHTDCCQNDACGVSSNGTES